MLLGETLQAEEALAAGLVDKTAPDADVQAAALVIARKLAAGPTRAFGEIKRLFLNTSSRGAASQMEEEAQALARIARTDDAWEGMISFIQKRPAKFTGN